MANSGLIIGVIIVILIIAIGWWYLSSHGSTTTGTTTTSSGGSTSYSAGCSAGTGFSCGNITVMNNGNVTMSVGQSTGMNWSSWAIAFEPEADGLNSNAVNGSLVYNIPNASFSYGGNPSGAFPSGKTVQINFMAVNATTANSTTSLAQQEKGGWLIVCYTEAAGKVVHPSKGTCGTESYIYYAQLVNLGSAHST